MKFPYKFLFSETSADNQRQLSNHFPQPFGDIYEVIHPLT